MEHSPNSSLGYQGSGRKYRPGLGDYLLLAQIEEQGLSAGLMADVAQLHLSVRSSKRLRGAGIGTIQQLIACTGDDLLSIEGLGVTTVQEIKKKLNSYLVDLANGKGRDLKSTDTAKQMALESVLPNAVPFPHRGGLEECRSGIGDALLLARIKERGLNLSEMDLWPLYLGIRASKRLEAAGISTVQQLATSTEYDLLNIDGLGVTTLQEIKKKLNAYLADLASGDNRDSDFIDIGDSELQTSLLENLEDQDTPLDDISVQVLSLSEQESSELGMFNINTIQELVNWIRYGFFTISEHQITTIRGIEKKLDSYLTYLARVGNQHSYSAESSRKLAGRVLVNRARARGTNLNAISVARLGLSATVSRGLSGAGIHNVEELVDYNECNLIGVCGLGISALEEVRWKLNTFLWTVCDIRPLSEELVDLATRLCYAFQDYVPLDEVPLPQHAQRRLQKAIGDRPGTLAQLKQLIEERHVQIVGSEQEEGTCAQTKTMKQAVDLLYKLLVHENIDYEINELVRHLDDRERLILTARFGVRKLLTLQAVGEHLHVTRERVRQLESRMRSKLARRVARSSLLYSIAGIALIRHLGEDATVDSWIQRLIDIGFLREDAAADILVAVSRLTDFAPFALPKEFDHMLQPHIPEHILVARKPILSEARRFCRTCGAVRTLSLVNKNLSESDVGQILCSDGFAEICPGWWMRKGYKSVAEHVATKVITYCGAVSPSNLRQAITRHLSRLQFPAPPSEVLVRFLEQTGNFTLVDEFVKLVKQQTRKPGLTGPESIFVRTVQSEGPVISFELLYTKILSQGLSEASLTGVLHYSPIVQKVAFGLYTLLGAHYDIEDIERAKSQMTRVPANASIKPRPDGVIEFETNIGTWMIYGGVLTCGPAASMRGTWTRIVKGVSNGVLVVGSGFIRDLSDAVESLGLMPRDRVRIEFNTWTREATITKV
jgi:RNA polymerase sigma factor (sigma-70 family)